MSEPQFLLLLNAVTGLASGLALGVVFFGGLWWTTQRLLHSRRPALLALTSLLVRMGCLAAGMYLITRIGAVAAVAAAAGMLVVRSVIVRRVMAGQPGVGS